MSTLAPTQLEIGKVYRIHVPWHGSELTGLVRAKRMFGELCTERANGRVEEVRCEPVNTYFTPATPTEAAQFETQAKW